MSLFNQMSHNIRDTVDNISDGWQHLWNKARNAITHFTPVADEHGGVPEHHGTSQWGVLSADVRETSDAIEVLLEAPGMEVSDFDITVRDQSLIVNGTKRYSNERKEGHYHITERAYGSFQRVLPLPKAVDESKAKAKYTNGVLSIKLPTTESTSFRRIEVE